MKSTELRAFLSRSGIKPEAILLLDANYALPTEQWVHGSFASALDTVLSDLGLSKWSEEAWDCDKFSRLAWGYFSLLWGKTPGRPQAGAAFGMCCYMSERLGGGHCINVFVHRDSEGVARLQFVEPQKQLGGRLVEVRLSPEEIATIWSIIL